MSMTAQEPTLTRTRVDWAPVPRVNLLPPEIIEGRRFRGTQVRLAAVVACVVLGGVGAAGWAQYQVSLARAEQAVVQARTAQLQSEAASYAEVPKVLAEVDAATGARERAMATDVLWYRFLDELAVATPATVSLTSLDMAMSTGVATSQDVLSRTDLGEVVVSGDATRMPEVAAWLSAVASVHGMDISRLQSAVRNEGSTAASGITFTSAVGITTSALSHRYDRKAG
jgi:Tfp pilus assembly protein PilN